MWKQKYWCSQLPIPRHKEHSSRKHFSLISHLRQILYLISRVKTSCWHSVVQGDGKAVSPPQQNTAVSTDNTANGNQPTSRTTTCSVLAFFVPWSTRTNSCFKKGWWIGQGDVPPGSGGIVSSAGQYSRQSHPLVPAGSSALLLRRAKGCREIMLHLTRDSFSLSTNWPKHMA